MRDDEIAADVQRMVPLVILADQTPNVAHPERNIIAGGMIKEVGNDGQLYQGLRNHTGGKSYEHGDPTADKALQTRPTKQWLESYAKWRADGVRLHARGLDLVGVPVDRCPDCERPITDDDRTERREGAVWHERCARRVRRKAMTENSGHGANR